LLINNEKYTLNSFRIDNGVNVAIGSAIIITPLLTKVINNFV
jgi:hypothetical protein